MPDNPKDTTPNGTRVQFASGRQITVRYPNAPLLSRVTTVFPDPTEGETPVSPVPYGERPRFYPTQAFYDDDGTVTYVHHGSQGPTWSETKPQPTKPEAES